MFALTKLGILICMSFEIATPVKIFCDHSVITNHARDHGRDHFFYRDHVFGNA